MICLCILLKWLAFPCQYTGMVPIFGRNETELCLIYSHMFDYIYTTPSLFAIMKPTCFTASNLYKSMLMCHTWKRCTIGKLLFGFIDSTVIEICRPKPIYQCNVYSDHKRVHSIKFHSLTLPNGLIGNLFLGLMKGDVMITCFMNKAC